MTIEIGKSVLYNGQPHEVRAIGKKKGQVVVFLKGVNAFVDVEELTEQRRGFMPWEGEKLRVGE